MMITFAMLVSQPSSSNYSAFIFIWFSPKADPEISSLFRKWSQEAAVREWEIEMGGKEDNIGCSHEHVISVDN